MAERSGGGDGFGGQVREPSVRESIPRLRLVFKRQRERGSAVLHNASSSSACAEKRFLGKRNALFP